MEFGNFTITADEARKRSSAGYERRHSHLEEIDSKIAHISKHGGRELRQPVRKLDSRIMVEVTLDLMWRGYRVDKEVEEEIDYDWLSEKMKVYKKFYLKISW